MSKVEIRNMKSLINRHVGGDPYGVSFELWSVDGEEGTLMCEVETRSQPRGYCQVVYRVWSKLHEGTFSGEDKYGDNLRKHTEAMVREHHMDRFGDDSWHIHGDHPQRMGFWAAFDLWVQDMVAEHGKEVC